MSVFKSGEIPPEWCELKFFQVIEVTGEARAIAVGGGKQRLLVTRGACRLATKMRVQVFAQGQFCDLDEAEAPYTIDAGDRTSQVIVFTGSWGSELGGCGVFQLNETTAFAKGDSVDYPKSTQFDSHYHDCDEYWVIVEGAGTVVIDSRSFEVEKGDCIAIGMGHQHDFPKIRGDVRGAYFETTLEGKKRFGHLWKHKHGPADVRVERV